MSASTHIWLYSPRNTRLANIAPSWEARKGYRFSYLRYRRSGHEVTELVLRMPKKSAPPRAFFALDSRLEVWRADGPGPARLDMDTVWFVRVPPKLIYGPKGEQLIEVRAVNGLYLLAGRIVAYASGSAQAVKSGPADDVMKAVVREKLGSAAIAERDLSAWLSVDPDVGLGAGVYRTFPRSNVLRVLQALSRASAQGGNQVFFDVVPENGGLVFRTFLGQRGADRRRSSTYGVTLSPEFGTLQNVERAEDHRDEFTVIYTAGQGVGDTRMLVTLTDAERVNGSPFNRREQFVDARYIPTEQGLSTEADATLWRGRPDQVFSGVLPPHVYGRRVRWGDRATAELDGEVVDCVLHGVEVELQGGEEVIRVDLRSDGADAEDAVRKIEGAIDAGGGADAPLFTVTPAPHAVPLGDAGGHIADGWLNSTIARVSDIPSSLPPSGAAGGDLGGSYPCPSVVALRGVPVESTVPGDGELLVGNSGEWALSSVTGIKGVQELAGVYKVPMAGAGGKIDDGWLNTSIARVSDIPSSLPPSGAADGDLADNYPNPTVKAIYGFEFEDPNSYGQPDQGAVYVYDQSWPGWLLSDVTGIKGVSYTPGAYTVPSANNLGKIADSYLSSAIARLTDITWSNVSGKPSTFAPASHASSHASAGSDPITPAAIGAAASSHTHTKANITDLQTITATPTASAIPLADGTGDLNDGWLSANIPRLNAANTFSVAQTLSLTSATTNATFAMMTYNALSSGVTAAGFGQDHYFNLEADSGTNRNAALMRVHWAAATDASRRGRILFYVYDAVGARECLRLESTGAAPAVGFNGVAAVARQSLTALSMAVGTGDDSVADVGTAFNQTTLNNNFRDLVNKVNAIRTILVNVGIAV